MKKWVFLALILTSITKAFPQEVLMSDFNSATSNYYYNQSSGDMKIDSTVASELNFFSNMLMMKLSCSYYAPCAPDSLGITDNPCDSLLLNKIFLNLNDLQETRSTGLLESYVPALVMHKLSLLLIKKYALKFTGLQALAFSDYLTGYYLKKREFFVRGEMPIRSLQLICGQQEISLNTRDDFISDLRLNLIKDGMNDCDLAFKRRQNVPLRDVIYNGISIAHSVEE